MFKRRTNLWLPEIKGGEMAMIIKDNMRDPYDIEMDQYLDDVVDT